MRFLMLLRDLGARADIQRTGKLITTRSLPELLLNAG
jgi:hypothetical protein